MSKRKMTHQQQARVKRHQAKQQHHQTDLDASLGSPTPGRVIAHYGTQVDVETDQGLVRCAMRQHLGLVVGDNVVIRPALVGPAVVVAVEPRQQWLGRYDIHGKIKAIAANIDQVFIVIAPMPPWVSELLDSYLVAMELLSLSVTLILNKVDLASALLPEQVAALAQYESLGYPVLRLSTQEGERCDVLQPLLVGKTSVFVGQSGVGKSSIIAALHPDAGIKVGALKSQSGLGSHTTSRATLYHLATGGDVIDSPGIRDFGLWPMPFDTLARGFREFHAWLTLCQFRNCRHVNERGCAIIAARDRGEITVARHASYVKLLSSLT